MLEGLEQFAVRELQARFPHALIDVSGGQLTVHSSRFSPSASTVNALRTVTAAYYVLAFDIPRPKALLGDQHLRRVVEVCERTLAEWPPRSFRTLALSAAGADSAVLTRFKDQLAERLGLVPSASQGDLLLRIRRARASHGWEVLVRTSPRPLSSRAWRVCNLPGALNATVARAMIELTQPSPSDVFVNVGCGSGTLLIERLEHGPAKAAHGYDVDDSALACARANADASGHGGSIALERCDARALPLDSGIVDAVVGDLPYAMLLGSGSENARLYPALLAEAARVLRAGGRAVFITTQNRLMRGVLEAQRSHWERPWQVSVKVPHSGGYITPTIYSFVRRHPL